MKSTGLRKLQIAGIVIGVTVAIYLIIKFLLPLLAPFVLAFIIALVIDRPVNFLVRKLKWKRVACTLIMLLLVLIILGTVVFLAGRILVRQVKKFIDNYDEYYEMLQDATGGLCDELGRSLIPTVMHGSIDVVAALAWFFTTLTLVIMGTVFLSKDMEKMRAGISNSIFRDEICFIGGRMKEILGTYFKTQFIIMSITCLICTAGLYILGNPYGFLIGILIGIVDAFPVLGTGTVFVPWGVILVVMGKYRQAVGIFAIYLVCYYVRQFLEPKLMGNNLGVSPILMLVSLYLGLVLFGITGVITGPIAAILIREITLRAIKNL